MGVGNAFSWSSIGQREQTGRPCYRPCTLSSALRWPRTPSVPLCVVEFAVLGPLEVWAATGSVQIRRGLPRTLLIALLLRPGQAVSSDLLVDLLWGGDEQPRNPANALQIQISYLRKTLASTQPDDASLLETRAGGYSLIVDRSRIDAHRFESTIKHLAPSDALRSSEELSAALDEVDAALGLWRGDALEDVAGMDFARGEITRLDELRWAATERRIELLLRLGRHSDAVWDLSELVQRLPLRERFHEQLMLALYRSGRQAEALRAYERRPQDPERGARARSRRRTARPRARRPTTGPVAGVDPTIVRACTAGTRARRTIGCTPAVGDVDRSHSGAAVAADRPRRRSRAPDGASRLPSSADTDGTCRRGQDPPCHRPRHAADGCRLVRRLQPDR